MNAVKYVQRMTMHVLDGLEKEVQVEIHNSYVRFKQTLYSPLCFFSGGLVLQDIERFDEAERISHSTLLNRPLTALAKLVVVECICQNITV